MNRDYIIINKNINGELVEERIEVIWNSKGYFVNKNPKKTEILLENKEKIENKNNLNQEVQVRNQGNEKLSPKKKEPKNLEVLVNKHTNITIEKTQDKDNLRQGTKEAIEIFKNEQKEYSQNYKTYKKEQLEKKSYQKLEEILAKGYEKINVEGDGNCMFRAIVEVYNNITNNVLYKMSHEELRKLIIEYEKLDEFSKTDIQLRIDKALFLTNSTKTIRMSVRNHEQYFRKMELNGTWGSSLELCVASEVLLIPIVTIANNLMYVVFFGTQIFNVSNFDNLPNNKILLYHEDDCHYQALLPIIVVFSNQKKTNFDNKKEFGNLEELSIIAETHDNNNNNSIIDNNKDIEL